MSQELWTLVQRDMQAAIGDRLRRWRQPLSRTTGILPTAQSPTVALDTTGTGGAGGITGILGPDHGGTGVDNGSRTLTWNTNSGTLDFTAASKTLTIAQSLILDGTSGKSLVLTGGLTVGADTTITGGGTLALGGFTGTLAGTGTLITGTGAAGRVAYWGGTNTLTSDANHTWDATNHTLDIETGGAATTGHLRFGSIATGDYLDMFHASADRTSFFRYASAGVANFDWNPVASDGTGVQRFRLFRQSNSSGLSSLDIFEGNNTGNLNTQLAGNGSSYIGALYGNFGVRATTFGASAVGVLAIKSGTAPTTSPTDTIQMWSADTNSTAGKAGMHLRTEDGTSHVFGHVVGLGTLVPTQTLSFDGNAARTVWMERHTTSNTAGNTLTLQAGGATSGATDKAGGNLILSPGASTGTGRAYTQLKGYTVATATGTTDNTQLDRAIVGAFKALTNNTAVTVVNVTVASNTVAAGELHYAIEVFNGTDLQVEEGIVSYHVTNKAGAIANNTTVKDVNQQAATSGTLTVTWAISAANPALLSVNANSSLTPSAGYPRVTYTLHNLTQQAVAVQ